MAMGRSAPEVPASWTCALRHLWHFGKGCHEGRMWAAKRQIASARSKACLAANSLKMGTAGCCSILAFFAKRSAQSLPVDMMWSREPGVSTLRFWWDLTHETVKLPQCCCIVASRMMPPYQNLGLMRSILVIFAALTEPAKSTPARHPGLAV